MNYTDKRYWEQFWAKYKPSVVKEGMFLKRFDEYLPGPESRSIEIGGFPGICSVYFKKFKNYDVTLLDYLIIPGIIKEVERINSIEGESIKVIKADFLTFKTDDRYDVVFSCGFIEHFKDVRDILQRHCNILKRGGTLLVTLPNFRGLNGFINRIFDRMTYNVHNIEAMDIKKLDRICRTLGLRKYDIFYFGNTDTPYIWICNWEKVALITRIMLKILNKIISFLGINNRLLGPHIAIVGKKNNSG